MFIIYGNGQPVLKCANLQEVGEWLSKLARMHVKVQVKEQ